MYISFYEAYPPVSGAASVTYGCAKHAPGERHVIQLGSTPGQQTTPEGVQITTIDRSEGMFGKLCGLPRRLHAIVRRVRELDPDVIVLEGASWAVYLYRLLRKLRQHKLKAKILYHSHNVELILRQQKHGKLVCALTRVAEGRLLRGTDRAFAVSSVDQHHFRQLYAVETELWPNGVDVARFDAVTTADIDRVKEKYRLQGDLVLFMGLYAYPPNKKAVDFLVDEVFPQLVENGDDARLVIVGGKTPLNQPWIINPGTIPHDELPAFIKACDVGVAPVFSGSGTRLKILEYMAAGLPVVSTTKGAEGLQAIAGRDLCVADDASTFYSDLLALLQDEQRAGQMSEAGNKLVHRLYNWPEILKSAGFS